MSDVRKLRNCSDHTSSARLAKAVRNSCTASNLISSQRSGATFSGRRASGRSGTEYGPSLSSSDFFSRWKHRSVLHTIHVCGSPFFTTPCTVMK